MTDPQENLADKIKKSLEGHGHSLEMRVAKAFRENGFKVSQFEYFVDQDTNLVRQIDVVASISKIIAKQLVTINLIIECKYAKKKPWVILQTEQKFNKYAFFEKNLQGEAPANWKNIDNTNGQFIGCLLLNLIQTGNIEKFSVKSAGYTILENRFNKQQQPDPTQKDHAYQAILQTTKAVAHIESQINEDNKLIFRELEYGAGTDTGLRNIEETYADLVLNFSINIPVIIINGQLFEGKLDKRNEIAVEEIDYGVVLTAPRQYKAKKTSRVPLSPVYVATEDKLTTFIQEMREKAEIILSQESVIQDIVKTEISKLPSKEEYMDF